METADQVLRSEPAGPAEAPDNAANPPESEPQADPESTRDQDLETQVDAKVARTAEETVGQAGHWQALARSTTAIENSLERLVRLDEQREQRFSKLHRELEEHRRGLVDKLRDPIFLGLIRLRDDFAKRREAWLTKDPEEQKTELLLNALAHCVEDVDVLLEQHGVTAFEEPTERFSPDRQTVARTVDGSAEQTGRLAARLRPGFETEGRLLVKERVAVFARTSLEPDKEPIEE
jgi:molecular chaperone GrpE (heat shock protein)